MREGSYKLARLQGRRCTVSGSHPIQKTLEFWDLNLSCCSDATCGFLDMVWPQCEIPSNSSKSHHKEIKVRTSSLPVKILMTVSVTRLTASTILVILLRIPSDVIFEIFKAVLRQVQSLRLWNTIRRVTENCALATSPRIWFIHSVLSISGFHLQAISFRNGNPVMEFDDLDAVGWEVIGVVSCRSKPQL
jgi:hypothetical protein